MSLFAGTGSKTAANKKIQQNQELGPKFAAVKVLLESSAVFNFYPVSCLVSKIRLLSGSFTL